MDIEGPGPLGEERLDAETLEPHSLAPETLSDEDRLLIVFAYLGPLSLVSLLASRREVVAWHARQGLLFGVTVLGIFVLLRPFHILCYLIMPFLGQIFLTLEVLTGFGFFLVAALCLVRGLEGTRFRIPLLADLVDRF